MYLRQSPSSFCCLSFLTYHGSFNYSRAYCLSPNKHVKVWPFASDGFHQKLPCIFLTLLNTWISYLLCCLGCQIHFTALVWTFCHPTWLHKGRCRYMLSADAAKETVVMMGAMAIAVLCFSVIWKAMLSEPDAAQAPSQHCWSVVCDCLNPRD